MDIEHAIRNNVCNKKYRNEYLRDWFTTDAIYTSTYDPISRILQLDVDGDKLLVLAQPLYPYSNGNVTQRYSIMGNALTDRLVRATAQGQLYNTIKL